MKQIKNNKILLFWVFVFLSLKSSLRSQHLLSVFGVSASQHVQGFNVENNSLCWSDAKITEMCR